MFEKKQTNDDHLGEQNLVVADIRSRNEASCECMLITLYGLITLGIIHVLLLVMSRQEREEKCTTRRVV